MDLGGAVKVGSQFAVLTGEPSEIMAAAPALTAKASDAAGVPVASVLLARPGKKPVQLADLLANELKNNPDGQTQFDADGNPMDSLSNPLYLINDRQGLGAGRGLRRQRGAAGRPEGQGLQLLHPAGDQGRSMQRRGEQRPRARHRLRPSAHRPGLRPAQHAVRLDAEQQGAWRGPGLRAGRILRQGEAGDLRARRAHRCRGRLVRQRLRV